MNLESFKAMHSKLIERDCSHSIKSILNAFFDTRNEIIDAIKSTDDPAILEYVYVRMPEFRRYVLSHKSIPQTVIDEAMKYDEDSMMLIRLNKHLTSTQLDHIAHNVKGKTKLQLIMRHPNASIDTIKFIGTISHSPTIKHSSDIIVKGKMM